MIEPKPMSERQESPGRLRRYFDNAATSFPKPPAVFEAIRAFAERCGAPGRGSYAEARHAGRIIRTCRERINTLLHGESPDHVVFTLNASDALNLAIKGVVAHAKLHDKRGGKLCVITSTMEHNSVLRPTSALAEEGVEVIRVPAAKDGDDIGRLDPERVRDAIIDARKRGLNVVLVALNHASNVIGTIQPAAAVGRICRELGVLFLLDAAQSLGHIPIDVRDLNVDLLAFPGHKGLLGPQGTGGLYIRPGVEDQLRTVREGGTGSSSELPVMPSAMPDKYEAGSHNTLGIAGLSEGVQYLLDKGVEKLHQHEQTLTQRFLDHLLGRGTGVSPVLPGLTLLGSTSPDHRVGVISVVHESIPPHELAAILETEFGILTRAGLHCAPLVHELLGTAPSTSGGRVGHGQGAVRFSLGPFLTEADVDAAADALQTICAGANEQIAATR